MSDPLLTTLQRRFAAAAEMLPAAMPAIESDEPIAFLLRYRRDALAGIPEPTFRRLRAAAREEHDVERRRASARRALEKAGKLSEALAARLAETRDVTWIEDLVRPLRGETGSKDPMIDVARRVLAGESAEPIEDLLRPFCGADGAHPTAEDQRARLVGLVAGLLGDDADLRAAVRAEVRRAGTVATTVTPEHASSEAWKELADATHAIGEMKPRELFLLRRGQKLGAVRVRTVLPDDVVAALLAGPLAPREGHPYAAIVAEAAKESLERHLLGAAGAAALTDRRRHATRGMMPRIMKALYERLMTAPAGAVPVVAVAPGTQGSCRLLAVDAQGRPGATAAVHPQSHAEADTAPKALTDMVRESGARIVAVPSGRRARGARTFAEAALAADRELGAAPVVVNEAPALTWSETDAARAEAPELAASARAALSMARSVQDPLVEASRWDLTELPLDPAQRDIDQGELKAALDDVFDECVAEVGVDVNTAPLPLLARVPGLGAASAKAIVDARAAHGTFPTRAKVREVEGITELEWQRAGGFLRVRDGVDPLDATGVHPTGLDVVAAIAAAKGVEPGALVGNAELLEGVDPAAFAGPVHTAGDVESVLRELRAGRSDPRTAFVAPAFNPGVQRLQDLQAGMEVDGTVASLQKFGAFVDLGVRQHGLVHVSEISHDYVQDPSQALTVGQKVRVKVLGVDPAKRRISLSIKAMTPAPERPAREAPAESGDRPQRFGGGGGPRRFRDGGAPAGAPAGAMGGAMGAAPAASPGGGFGGGFGGPRPPRRDGPGGPPGRRGGRDDRAPAFDGVVGPGGVRFERPGTPPRRAAGARGGPRRGTDRRGDSMFGGRGGRGEPAADEPLESGPPPKLLPRAVDPFTAQLQALARQLGGAAPAKAPAPAPAPAADEGPRNRKERRAALAAERARQIAAGIVPAEAPADGPADVRTDDPAPDAPAPAASPPPEAPAEADGAPAAGPDAATEPGADGARST